MIKEYVERFQSNKDKIKAVFEKEIPEDYEAIIKTVVKGLFPEGDSYDDNSLDPDRITEIDNGNYQGTLVYVIGATGYQPEKHYYVRVDYGSCSGCDTLEDIRGYSGEKPNEQQVHDLMTLALHVVQGLKAMQGESV